MIELLTVAPINPQSEEYKFSECCFESGDNALGNAFSYAIQPQPVAQNPLPAPVAQYPTADPFTSQYSIGQEGYSKDMSSYLNSIGI